MTPTPHERLREAAKAVLATAANTSFSGICEHAEALASLREALAAVDALPVAPTVEQRIAAVMENKAITALLPVTAVPQAGAGDPFEDGTISELQDQIRDYLVAECTKLGLPGDRIDGGGCDSGDWRDFTMSEIRQGLGMIQEHYADQLTASQARVEALVSALQKAADLIAIPAQCHANTINPELVGLTGTPRYSAGLLKLHRECHDLLPVLRQALAGTGQT